MSIRDVLQPSRPQTSAYHGAGTPFNQRDYSSASRASRAAQKFVSPHRIGGGSMIGGPSGSAAHAMNHAFLNNRSDIFTDDALEQVEKRCFLLLCGKQANDSFLSIDIVINAFDDPRTKKNLQLNMVIDQVIIEYNNEILKSLTALGLEYRLATNYSDLHPNPCNGSSSKRSLWRSLEMQAPLYVLKKHLLRRCLEGSYDQAIKEYSVKFFKEVESAKPEGQKTKEAREKQVKLA
jgi:hypothetical protein